MKYRIKWLLYSFFLGLLLLSNVAISSNKIYKCVDEFGRPIFAAQAVCSDATTVQLKNNKRRESKEINEQSREAYKNAKKQCKSAKKILTSYKKAVFLTKFVEHEGKKIKVRLTEQERDKTLRDAQNEMDYWCSKLK